MDNPLLRLLGLVYAKPGWCLLAFALLALPVLRYFYRNSLSPIAQRRLAIAGMISAVLLIAVFEAGNLNYATSNFLSDHVEANVISLSASWGAEHPLYAPLQSAQRCSLLYGPDMFILNRAGTNVIGASIPAAKFIGAFLAAAGLILLFFLFRAESSAGIALGCLTYCVLATEMLTGTWTTSPFWARGEPFLVFCVIVGLMSARISNRSFAVLGLGIALGFIVNIKLHGPVFLLPAAVLFIRKHGLSRLFIALAIATIIAALPFALPGMSLRNYLVWIHVAGSHPLVRGMLRGYVLAGTIAGVPVAAILGICWIRQRAHQGQWAQQDLWFYLACLATLAINMIPAMKLGSGVYHFLPLVPLLGFILCRSLAQLQPGWSLQLADLPWVSLIIAATLVMLAKFVVDERALNATCSNGGAWATQIIDEIKQIEHDNPGQTVAMGYGDTASYMKWSTSAYRTQLVFDHQPYLLDAAAVMDTRLAGIPLAPATIDYLKSGQVAIWLIPKGTVPFSMVRVNEPESSPKIFDPAFREVFFACYHRSGSTDHFDLWRKE